LEWYEDEVRDLERARAANPLPPHPIIFYGSSSLRLWTSLADDFPTLKPINLGFGGSTLAACVWFFERLVVPYHPRHLVIYAGDNDLGDGQQPADVVGSFLALVHKIVIHLGSIPVTFMSIKPSPARLGLFNQIMQTNEAICREIAERDGYSYVDIFHPMLDSRCTPRPELYAEDGLHLSAAGYRVWTQVLSAHLLR
jgi:lysophospholipase L1-like esterase